MSGQLIQIHGYSDDLVYVEGAVEREIGVFMVGEDEPLRLEFSNGALVDVEFTDGGRWEFEITNLPEEDGYTVLDDEADIAPDYSQQVNLWSEVGVEWVRIVGKESVEEAREKCSYRRDQ